jgi:hypothetical protein
VFFAGLLIEYLIHRARGDSVSIAEHHSEIVRLFGFVKQ